MTGPSSAPRGEHTPAPGVTSTGRPRKTQPCRSFVSGGTVYCCEDGETDCPCVCHDGEPQP